LVMFIDDILVYSKTKEENVDHIRLVLKTLEEHRLDSRLKKCELWLEKVHFLVHVVP